jgi:DHA2 family multidrug resistance protein
MTAAAESGAGAAPLNRPMIIGSVMLATVLVTLDQTIANVALPHIAGSLSASQDQIAWILTSYIVAAAICTPISGWLANRVGRKRLLLVSVIGFIAGSALCGAAQNLPEILIFRVIQGMFGAPLMPLSQALVLDLYSGRDRGPVMAIWGVGVMVAPILGPVLGGWLTESWSWRWVFYINLPVGALCLLGMMTFVPDTPIDRSRKFDWVGFSLLGIAIAALQLVFDRGQSQGWFDSSEIVIEASVAFVALWFSLVHSFTSAQPFLPIALFRDRNFATASILGVMVGAVIFSVIALLPLMMQTVYGYSALQTGELSAPRGVGSIISMLIVGRLMNGVDTRITLLCGQLIFAAAFTWLSTFTLDTPSSAIVLSGMLQGLGTGFMFLPLNIMAFGTMPEKYRGDGTSFYTLMRSLGSSAGISSVLALVANLSAHSRAQLVTPYSPDNVLVQQSLPAPLSMSDPTGIALLSSTVDRQAALSGYTQVFHLMVVLTLCMAPMLLLLRSPKHTQVQKPMAAAEH